MNVMAGAALCATLAGIGAAALLFAPALLPDPRATPIPRAGLQTPTISPAAVTVAVNVPEIDELTIEPSQPPALPPSFALDLTFAAAPLRPGFVDGSPVFSADLAPREIPSGEGALLLHRTEPGDVPAPEGPPLSGSATPPALARLAASTVLQVRPPLRPAFSETASAETPQTLGAPVEPAQRTVLASLPSIAGAENGREVAVAAPIGYAAVAATPSFPAFESPVPLASPFAGAIAARGGQAGIASWYGPGFHGRRTASGERFNQNDMTAAHPHLPFGSRVRVVDERTGRSIVVRINDRGPFKPGRIIDLSKASAQALGMGGLARVKLVSAE